MTNLARKLMTESEYLEMERNSDVKHEYYQGEIFAMAGAKRAHNAISVNILIEIGTQLKDRPCIVFGPDMRVQVSSNGLYTYPDIVAVCGEEKYLDKNEDTLLNPSLVIEVLSESTENYDRGKKFALYRGLESLKEYVLVSSEYRKVEIFRKNTMGQWVLSDVNENEPVVLESVDCGLLLNDIYSKVEFPESVSLHSGK